MGRELVEYYLASEEHKDKVAEKIIEYMFNVYSAKDVARDVIRILAKIETEEQYDIANDMFVALTDWSLETLYADLIEGE